MQSHTEHLRQFLKQFIDPPENELQRLESLSTLERLRAGEYFLESGEACEYFGLILTGLCRTFYTDEDGKEFNRSFNAEGDIIGSYSGFLLNKPSFFCIQALEECIFLKAPFKNFIELYSVHECWNTLGRRIAEKLYLMMEQRVESFLLNSASDRYRLFLQMYPNLEARLPLYHVASYLGITPVSLSRIRATAKDNLITHDSQP